MINYNDYNSSKKLRGNEINHFYRIKYDLINNFFQL